MHHSTGHSILLSVYDAIIQPDHLSVGDRPSGGLIKSQLEEYIWK